MAKIYRSGSIREVEGGFIAEHYDEKNMGVARVFTGYGEAKKWILEAF